MGADLLITAVELKEGKAKCLKRINKLDWSDVGEMFKRFENAGIWTDEDAIRERMPDEELAFVHAEMTNEQARDEEQAMAIKAFDKEAVKWMKERLIEAVDCVYADHFSRNCNTLAVDGINRFLVTGGTSWGDDPSSEWDDFNLFNEFLGYPYWAKPKSKKRKEWEKIGRKK